MRSNDVELPVSTNGYETPTAEDEALWDLLLSQLDEISDPEFCFSDESIRILKQICPPAEGSSEDNASLVQKLHNAATVQDYEQQIRNQRQEPTLGTYVTFLMRKKGITASALASDANWDFQALKDLENDRLPPQRIPAQPLVLILKALNASREFSERLIFCTVRASKYQWAGTRGSLYRSAPSARRAAAESASLAARGETGHQILNPLHQEEMTAAQRLAAEVHALWETCEG